MNKLISCEFNIDTACVELCFTAHEKAHLARRNHCWKPLGFLILTVHWFNSLCWVAYVLLCRDIKLACDEDDVVTLSQKGDALAWSDFEPHQEREVGFGLYIMRYDIDKLFDVLVGGVLDETPWYIYLRVNNEADDRIDIQDMDAGEVPKQLEKFRQDI